MEKTSTLNLRVNPELKANAESVLSQLGIPMSTAVDMFLHQIVLTGGIPFSISLPKMPADINASEMTTEQIHAKLDRGYKDYSNGNVFNAEDEFEKLQKKLS